MKLSVEAMQLQEIRRSNSGFHIEGIRRQETVAVKSAIPGENFADISGAEYRDPDELAIFNDLRACKTTREMAAFLAECIDALPNQIDQIDRVVLQHLHTINLAKATELLRELQMIAPDRNWAASLLYAMEEAV